MQKAGDLCTKAGDEAKKCKSPAKSRRVSITDKGQQTPRTFSFLELYFGINQYLVNYLLLL